MTENNSYEFSDELKYEGPLQNGKPVSPGKLNFYQTYIDSSCTLIQTYNGAFTESGTLDGEGTLQNAVFEDMLQKGTWKNNELIEGEKKKGTCTYTGQWKNGQLCGQNASIDNTGFAKIVADFNNYLCASAKINFTAYGNFEYEGEVKVIVTKTAIGLDKAFENSEIDAKEYKKQKKLLGKKTKPLPYETTFFDYDGHTMYTYVPNGNGIMITDSGEIHDCNWTNGLQQGEGTLITPDGTRYHAKWKNGKCKKRKLAN